MLFTCETYFKGIHFFHNSWKIVEKIELKRNVTENVIEKIEKNWKKI